MKLSILYRGPLSSCNYGCAYCPFAKHAESAAELRHDAACLDRFVTRLESLPDHRFGVLFTPWGEALIRRHYQEAIARLTQMDHVEKVAIQTNLSCKLDWVSACHLAKLGLWCTYHPGEVHRETFLRKCQELTARGVRYSVGVVGLREHRDEIASLRRELPEGVYLWINAYKRDPHYYDSDFADMLRGVDPLFPINNRYHPSLGESCRAGESVFTVDGDGVMRRCHFIDRPIGNFHDDHWMAGLIERPCTNDTCGCHIGYVHLDRLRLYDTFGDGVLERIPERL